jgi:hypothetical protein
VNLIKTNQKNNHAMKDPKKKKRKQNNITYEKVEKVLNKSLESIPPEEPPSEPTQNSFNPIPPEKSLIPYREYPNLTLPQEAFMHHYRRGKNIIDSMKQIKMDRNTFWYWKRTSPEFRDELVRARAEYYDQLKDDSLSLVDKANLALLRAFEPGADSETIQAGRVALQFLEKTNRLPYAEDDDEEERKLKTKKILNEMYVMALESERQRALRF